MFGTISLSMALLLGAPVPKNVEPTGVGPGYLGVRFQANREGDGLRVTEVLPASPAAKGGIRPDDVIIRIEGKPVSQDTSELVQRIASVKPGSMIEVVILRADKEITLDIRIVARPKDVNPTGIPFPPMPIDPDDR